MWCWWVLVSTAGKGAELPSGRWSDRAAAVDVMVATIKRHGRWVNHPGGAVVGVELFDHGLSGCIRAVLIGHGRPYPIFRIIAADQGG